MTIYLHEETETQINESLNLLKDIFGDDLLGLYLYGSAVSGGLQKYSDVDLFVVVGRATTVDEKKKLISRLLQISGVYMQSSKLPIELTIVVQSEVNPWRYPATFDFQYGDWLRKEFESGVVEPWASKEMPDLALLIGQILLASKTVFGLKPEQLLCPIPARDLIQATVAGLKSLEAELHSDTRNVLLTYARIWNRLEEGNLIVSKPEAAAWAINRLPIEYQPVLVRARAICLGETDEHWDDIKQLIAPCAGFMVKQINSHLKSSGHDS